MVPIVAPHNYHVGKVTGEGFFVPLRQYYTPSRRYSLGTPETRRSGRSTLKALSAFTSTPSMLRKDIMTCTTLQRGDGGGDLCALQQAGRPRHLTTGWTDCQPMLCSTSPKGSRDTGLSQVPKPTCINAPRPAAHLTARRRCVSLTRS